MKTQLVILCIFIIFVASSWADTWSAPEFCHGYPCPQYTLIQDYGAFQERHYKKSLWAETLAQSMGYTDLSNSFDKIVEYTEGVNEAGKTLLTTTPAMVFCSESDSGEKKISTAVFMPPDSEAPKPTDSVVKLVVRPSATVYVRVFGGLPTETNLLDNVKQLQTDLAEAGKQYDPHRFAGAGYEPLSTLIGRHNEAWVFADNH